MPKQLCSIGNDRGSQASENVPMILNSFELGDQDSRIYPVNYGDWLADDETIIAIADETVAPVTVPAFTAVGSIWADGKGIYLQVGGGVADEEYSASFKITTSIVSTGGSQTRQDCLVFTVRGGCS